MVLEMQREWIVRQINAEVLTQIEELRNTINATKNR